MDNDKNFSAQVLSVIKGNLFEIKKLLFNLEDCVSKKDFDALKNISDNQAAKIIELEKNLNVKSAEISNLQNKNVVLQGTLSELEKTSNDNYNKLQDKTAELSNLQEKFDDVSAKLKNYVGNYHELDLAYNSYRKLSDSTKFALEGIFGAENSPTTFLAGALQAGHLESLFDYVATAINNGNDPAEIEILRELFDFTFNAANSGRREKIYTRLNTQAGNDFDSDEMKRTSNSSQSGKVENVLLVGYKYSRTEKIVKQSLVFIR